MTLVKFDSDADNVVSGSYSTGTGPVLRSDNMEVTKIFFEKGKGADVHTHPEEQLMYVLEGRLQVTCEGDTYEEWRARIEAEHGKDYLADIDGRAREKD